MTRDPKEAKRVPALELPYELTSQIFASCLPVRRRVQPHRNRAPLHLAQICSQWRAVALATPHLWSSIYLEFSESRAYDGIPVLLGELDADSVEDHTGALLDLWFTRAAGYPLSISLICSKHTSLPQTLMEVMSAHFTHWGRLELAIPMAAFLEFNEVTGPFPLLQSLSIQITDRSKPFSHIRVRTMHKSPNLKALKLLDQFSALTSPNDLAALPRTLTALQIADPLGSRTPYETLVRTFEYFPRLHHFSIPFYIWPQSLGNGNTPRLAPPLKSLLLSHIPATLDLNFLDIPALEHLQVTLWGAAPPPYLIAFLSRSGRQLTHLTLDLEYLEHKGPTACLSALPPLPALATLELLLPTGGTPRASSAEHYRVLHRPDFLPQLRALIVTDTARMDTYAPFVALLRARPALVHAELHLWSKHADVRRRMPPPGPQVVSDLAALTGWGRSVRVTTPTYAWPANARDEDPFGDLDHDVFGSRKTRPYFFSPF
ncbi:hypothetical protein B0H13DRAFT_1713155 [Mycena leptocephala]|nr:hypothetical protein B0H13DRAFT_1713155 [Mycena leptocephala]